MLGGVGRHGACLTFKASLVLLHQLHYNLHVFGMPRVSFPEISFKQRLQSDLDLQSSLEGPQAPAMPGNHAMGVLSSKHRNARNAHCMAGLWPADPHEEV